MSDLTHLQKRRQGWYVRVRVPDSLYLDAGKRHIIRSLKTRDLDEARRRRWAVVAKIKAYLDDLRKSHDSGNPLAAKMAEAKLIRRDFEQNDPEWRRDVGLIMADEADKMADRYGHDIAKQWYDIATAHATPLSDYIDPWLAEAMVTSKTEVLYRAAVKSFMTWCGGEVLIEKIDRKLVGLYVSDYLATTGRAAKTNNRDITALSSLWRYLMRRGQAEENPWLGQRLTTKSRRGNKATQERQPFTDNELAKLIELAPYYGTSSDLTLHDVIVIGALTGMRLEEICQLQVRDCQDDAFDIVEGKSTAAVRVVPIHPQLREIITRRLTDKADDEYLFETLIESGPDQRRSEALSKRLSRLIRKTANITDRSKTFHSLRHRFVTKVLQAGNPEWIVKDVVGHSQSGVTLSVYSQGASLEQKRLCVESVLLP